MAQADVHDDDEVDNVKPTVDPAEQERLARDLLRRARPGIDVYRKAHGTEEPHGVLLGSARSAAETLHEMSAGEEPADAATARLIRREPCELALWEIRLVLRSLLHEKERLETRGALSESDEEIADLPAELRRVTNLLSRLQALAVGRFGGEGVEGLGGEGDVS